MSEDFSLQAAATNLRNLAEVVTGKLYTQDELFSILDLMTKKVVELALVHETIGLVILKRECSCGWVASLDVTTPFIEEQWDTHFRDTILNPERLEQFKKECINGVINGGH